MVALQLWCMVRAACALWCAAVSLGCRSVCIAAKGPPVSPSGRCGCCCCPSQAVWVGVCVCPWRACLCACSACMASHTALTWSLHCTAWWPAIPLPGVGSLATRSAGGALAPRWLDVKSGGWPTGVALAPAAAGAAPSSQRVRPPLALLCCFGGCVWTHARRAAGAEIAAGNKSQRVASSAPVLLPCTRDAQSSSLKLSWSHGCLHVKTATIDRFCIQITACACARVCA
jgi:hypothetical protein